MTVEVESFDRFEPLLEAAPALFAARQSAGFFATPAWWRTVVESGLPPGAVPCFLLCRDAGRPVAMLALQRQGGGLAGMTNPYTCLFAPLLAGDLDAHQLMEVGRSLGGFCRSSPVLRLDAMDRDMPGLDDILAGLRAAGLKTRSFSHFGNWHMRVDGSWPDYLQARPGELRETIRRRLRRMEREQVGFELIRAPADLDAGIAAYEDVYARSWKTPEPYPDFNPRLMHYAATDGMLRLGLLRTRAGLPIACQLWVVAQGQATVLKLAHDEAFKPLSPGTLLTALMIQALLENEPIEALDFGRGDDPYKRLWASTRRQRIGLLLIDPWRPRGMAMLARQGLADALARFRHRREAPHADPA